MSTFHEMWDDKFQDCHRIVIIVSAELFDEYKAHLAPTIQYQDVALKNAGITNLTYMGTPVIRGASAKQRPTLHRNGCTCTGCR